MFTGIGDIFNDVVERLGLRLSYCAIFCSSQFKKNTEFWKVWDILVPKTGRPPKSAVK